MKITNRREWLAITGSSLLSACGGGGDGSSPISPPSNLTITLSGPSSGIVNATSAVFTVSANGPVGGNIVVTPNAASDGGSFAPNAVTLTAAAPIATFTYTPMTVGAKAISVTNNQGLTNPASVPYMVTASFTNPTFTNVSFGRGRDETSETSVAIPAVTLTANRLALLSIVSVKVPDPVIPTVAGWTLVHSYVAVSLQRVSIFRRMSGTTSTQPYTISFGGQPHLFTRWSIDESSSNINMSGTNGSGAVVQIKQGFEVGTAIGTYCSLTFDSAFSNTANSTFAVFAASGTPTPTAGAGFTELSRAGVEPFGNRALFVEYKAANDATADMTWAVGYDLWNGVALEIAGGS